MSLTEGKNYPEKQEGWMGQAIFDEIIKASNRGVKVRIVQQKPSNQMPDYDTQNLTKMGSASVRTIDFQALMSGYSLKIIFRK